MSNDSPVLTSLTENSTDVPVSAGRVENYVLLLVLLCVFAGGTLVLLSLLLLFCHRCCLGGRRRYSRASDDPEKTNTTYVEDSQPTQEINIRLDESDALSASSCHDGESERFLSTGSTGRRVSFNESALYEQEKNQERGRRYTLTEGDFHHLKKARLTHLHLAPPPSALKILTIMECESADGSTANVYQTPPPKPPLAIYQPPERGVSWLSQSPSGGLPGDPHHSVILAPAGLRPPPAHGRTTEVAGESEGWEEKKERGMRGGVGSPPAPGQTSVLQFFSKLRRHASLEGAGPYFKKWKFDSSHRAASLDAKGSPKRRPIHRQRAASDTTDQTEEGSSPSGPAPPPGQSASLQTLSAGSLSPVASPSPSRWEVEVVVESEREVTPPGPGLLEAQQEEEGSGEGPGRGLGSGEGAASETGPAVRRVPGAQAAEDSAEAWSEPRDEAGAVAGAREWAGSGEEAEIAAGEEIGDFQAGEGSGFGAAGTGAGAGAEAGVEAEPEAEAARRGSDSGSALSCLGRQESCSLYRDIWSLRASLEQYASSDQSSTDRESVRSDADSVCSLGGAGGARAGADSCHSQDLEDEPEGEGGEGGDRGGEAGGGEGEGGGRKLLQMDSGYTSIEAPARAPEDLRLFPAPGGHRGKSASERRQFFTSSRMKGSVCESFEVRFFHEELEDEMTLADGGAELEEELLEKAPPTGGDALALGDAPPQPPKPQPASPPLPTQPAVPPLKPLPPTSPPRPRLRRRDYSIDEKTDALFNEFLRHDPRFDQPDSPLRSRHRSRVQLRKQWQRHKQYSDPGAGAGRYSPSLDRQRFSPLRRGDSAGYPLDTRYHSTLSRIASAADEEGAEGGASEAAESRELSNQRAGGKTTGSKGLDCEGGSKGTSCQASPNQERGEVSANKDQASGSLEKLIGRSRGMDPRVDNRNNNSSQAIQSESSPSIPSPPPGQNLPGAPADPKDAGGLSSGPDPAGSPSLSLPDPAGSPSPSLPRPQLTPQSSLADKLAATLEDRLYSGLRGQAGGPGQGGPECVGVVAVSPDHSPA